MAVNSPNTPENVNNPRPSAALTNAAVAQAASSAASGQRTTVAPSAEASNNTPERIRRLKRLYSERNTAPNATGVGGRPIFSISERVIYGGSANNRIVFEMAPARRSVYSNQGQMIPGAKAGMSIRMKFNTARSMMPFAKPVYQQMGISAEYLEIVGAFIGHDYYHDDYEVLGHPSGNKITTNAAVAADNLFMFYRRQREVVLELGWENGHKIEFDHGLNYTAYIREIKRSWATEERQYYQIILEVTNRNDTSVLVKKVEDGQPVGMAFGHASIETDAYDQRIKPDENITLQNVNMEEFAGSEYDVQRPILQNAYDAFSVDVSSPEVARNVLENNRRLNAVEGSARQTDAFRNLNVVGLNKAAEAKALLNLNGPSENRPGN
jgi:hypothetical protein